MAPVTGFATVTVCVEKHGHRAEDCTPCNSSLCNYFTTWTQVAFFS